MSSKGRAEHIDAVRLHAGHHEWIERDRRRKLGQLEQGRISQLSSQVRPWAPLGERPDGGSWTSFGDRTPDCSAHDREASRSTTAASRSCRSPAMSAGASIAGESQRFRQSSRPHSQASQPPQTAGSRPITSFMPPMTGMTASTTLSQMYRQAVSTPALRTSHGDLGGHNKHEETGLGGGCAGRSSEPWYCEHPRMNSTDLVKIVEHLHFKVLRERRKRLKAEKEKEKADLMSATWQSGSGPAASH